jgi:hypothetical protein
MLASSCLATPETTVPAFAGTVGNFTKAYFFLAAFFFATFFFAAFFFAAMLETPLSG